MAGRGAILVTLPVRFGLSTRRTEARAYSPAGHWRSWSKRVYDWGQLDRTSCTAAIAAVHAEAQSGEQTDWKEIAVLYQELERVHPSAVVSLNRAVAVALSEGLELGLSVIDTLRRSGELDSYHLYHAARADLLRRLGRSEEAADTYRRGLGLTANAVERRVCVTGSRSCESYR